MNLPGVYDIFLKNWSEYQTCWVISDTHFGDADIQKAFPNRPSDEELVKIINSKVGRKDVLIHLGDVGDLEFAKQLRGHKVLIMGNHDAGATNYKRKIERLYFDKTYYDRDRALQEAKAKYPGCRYSIYEKVQFVSPFESWVIECDNMLFDEVYEGPLMLGEKLLLSHEDINVPWAFCLHGHDHTGRQRAGALNVCLDGNGYAVMNRNSALKSGLMAKVETLHRDTINTATQRRKKRGGKKIGEK